MSSSSVNLVGFASAIVSCVAFGFMFAPLKRFDTKDGFFVQWIQCAVVFFVGFWINFARDFPPFNPIATIGGVLFATGNVASVPLVNGLGIGLGMFIWGSVQVTVGWCVARFGLFGTRAQPVYNNAMNITGLVLTLISGVIFFLVKHEHSGRTAAAADNAAAAITATESTEMESDGSDSATTDKSDAELRNDDRQHQTSARQNSGGDRTNLAITESRVQGHVPSHDTRQYAIFHQRITTKKLVLMGLAVFMGVLHGLMMTPVVYIMDTDPHASKNVLDFMFAHFSTIFAFSTLYFILYSIYKRNRPYAAPELVLPSVAYGILWSIGMVLFFVSNDKLSQVVSFPITTRLPSTIGILADVFLFRSIKGRRNLALMSAGVMVALTGVVLIAISNQDL